MTDGKSDRDRQRKEFEFLEVGDSPRQAEPSDDSAEGEPVPEKQKLVTADVDERDVSDELVMEGLAVPCVSCGENVILGPAEIASCPHCGFRFEVPLAPGSFESPGIEVPSPGPIPEPPTLLGRGDNPTFSRTFTGPGGRVAIWQVVLFILLFWGATQARAAWGVPAVGDGWLLALSGLISLVLTAGTARRFGAFWVRLTPFEISARWLTYRGRIRLSRVRRVESWIVVRLRRNPLRRLEDWFFSKGERYRRFDVKTRISGKGGRILISTYALGYHGWLQASRETLHFIARHNPEVEVDLNTLTLLGYRQETTGGSSGWQNPGDIAGVPES